MNPLKQLLSSPMPALTRRDLLLRSGMGLGLEALAQLVFAESAAAAGGGEGRHFTPKAKRVVQVFLTGGASQVDTFDYKPALEAHDGQPMPGAESVDTFNGKIGSLMKSPWAFRRHGQSGRWVSDLLPNIAGVVDDLTFLHGMNCKSANHGPAQLQMNCGFIKNGYPCLGAWFSYAMGSVRENLPFYVVLPDPRGIPAGGVANWGPGFLPAATQATLFRPEDPPVANLHPTSRRSPEEQREALELIGRLNGDFSRAHPGDTELEARVRAYELAGRMQVSVPEAVDLSAESAETRELYGLDDPICGAFARNCVLARRLVERGVRFVQLYQGGSAMKPRVNWDAHENVRLNHTQEARIMDRPVAGLIRDLKRRGLLEDTLFLWVTEFGRTPFSQGRGLPGRDHNQHGYTIFMTGAGVRRGVSHGATDEFGHRAVEGVVTLPDFHATVLHLLGLDHHRLTFYHNGIQRRISDVSGRIIEPILA